MALRSASPPPENAAALGIAPVDEGRRSFSGAAISIDGAQRRRELWL